MALNLPQSEVSVKGVKSCTLTNAVMSPSEKKPMGFVYQPLLEQRRIAGFDADGNRTPGVPVVIGRDYRLQLSYAEFNPQIAAALTNADVGDNYFDFTAVFAATDNSSINFSFDEACMVIDGQGISLDPLGNGMSLSFTCGAPATFA